MSTQIDSLLKDVKIQTRKVASYQATRKTEGIELLVIRVRPYERDFVSSVILNMWFDIKVRYVPYYGAK